MERVTVRLPERQLRGVEGLVEEGEFPNRSEAIRAAIRELVDEKNKIKTNRLETKTEKSTQNKKETTRRLTARKL